MKIYYLNLFIVCIVSDYYIKAVIKQTKKRFLNIFKPEQHIINPTITGEVYCLNKFIKFEFKSLNGIYIKEKFPCTQNQFTIYFDESNGKYEKIEMLYLNPKKTSSIEMTLFCSQLKSTLCERINKSMKCITRKK